VWFLGTTVLASGADPGYSHLRQYISELGSVSAPHGVVVSWLGFFPAGLLLMLACAVAALTFRRTPLTLLGLACLAWYAFGLVAGAVFPCDAGCRPDDPSFSQLVHDFVAGTGYLIAPVAAFLLGSQALQWPGAMPAAIGAFLCGALIVLTLPGLDPDFGWAGLSQRLIELYMAAWILPMMFLGAATSRAQLPPVLRR